METSREVKSVREFVKNRSNTNDNVHGENTIGNKSNF